MPTLKAWLKRSERYRSTGFSLVEVLVVAAIISVVLAFLFPVAGRLREGALRTGCVNNLRTIGTALTSYSIEHHGFLPGPSFNIIEIGKSYSISGKLKDYLEPEITDPVWECPGNPALIRRNREALQAGRIRYSSYLTRYPYFGYHTPKENPPAAYRLAKIKELPRDQQWIMRELDSWNYNQPDRIGGTYPPVHSGGRNYLYADLSVEWKKESKN